ncbi:Protein O-mannosyltransferase 2 [Mortierella alpina]|nr:Protein O-mannosyltransferase 2 [Mortierella alpina]
MTTELRRRSVAEGKEPVLQYPEKCNLYELDENEDLRHPVKPEQQQNKGPVASLHTRVSGNKDETHGSSGFYTSLVLSVILTSIAAWTRYRDIVSTKRVTWDEAHFGKFGSYYIRGEHYFDVHPPLAKMLVALSGIMAGYDGSYKFDAGQPYPDINYRFMRLFNASFGVMVVPIAYWTARELRMSKTGATFAATMVMLDNAYVLISRYILLDSMLLAATAFVVLCLTKFRNARNIAFTPKWWCWLAMTGVSLGLVSSMKWVGLFATALVGLYTIEELWNLFGDLSIPKVAYGSVVTIKNTAYGGTLLHSHRDTYPEGSRQQQITCYGHKDENNKFSFQRPWGANHTDAIQVLKHGDVVRLVHDLTGRNLHSHRIHAPLTVEHWEVSGYGNREQGDANDEWVLEIIGEQGNSARDGTLRSLSTTFRLRHRVLDCILTADRTQALPEWGFRQTEVYCNQKVQTKSSSSVWNIEQHWNSKLPPGGDAHSKSVFWNDFKHLNVAMMGANNALVPDPDKFDNLASNPSQWPLLAVGMRMNTWANGEIKFYLIGNPVVWWSSFASLGVFMVALAYYSIMLHRQSLPPSTANSRADAKEPQHSPQGVLEGYGQKSKPEKRSVMSPDEWDHFVFVGKVLVGGWFLHYLPFWIMARVTYLHHYFPALYFSILLCGYMVDHLVQRLARNGLMKAFAWMAAFGIVVSTFVWFWPATYGIHGPASETMDNRQWRATWDIVDGYAPRTFV